MNPQLFGLFGNPFPRKRANLGPGDPATNGNDGSGGIPMPGPISGYGGGTWNLDGSQATPIQRTAADVQPTGLDPSGITVNRPDMSALSGAIRNGIRERSQIQPQMGQPQVGFDYNAAVEKMAPTEKKRSTLQDIAAVLGPALLASSGNQALANFYIQNNTRRRQDAEDRRLEAQAKAEGWRHSDYARRDAGNIRDSAPFSSGRDRLRWNPETGEAELLYDGPEDFETYAQVQNLQPGTQDYFDAVEDYVLKGHGPSAFGRSTALDDHRTANDIRAEGIRAANRSALKGQPTYRDTHGAPPRQGSGGGKAPTGYSAPVTVKTPADAAKLAKGTRYRTPDGQVFTR